MVSQDLRRIVARPERVDSRAPLPLEIEVIVGRFCREAERGCAARGEIGIYGHGLSVEENLIAEIVRIHRRSPARRGVECCRGGGWSRGIEPQGAIRQRITRAIHSQCDSGELDCRHGVGRDTAGRTDVSVDPDYV
jgi:hypothetical protein